MEMLAEMLGMDNARRAGEQAQARIHEAMKMLV